MQDFIICSKQLKNQGEEPLQPFSKLKDTKMAKNLQPKPSPNKIYTQHKKVNNA